MCEPTTIMMGLAMASTAITVVGQKQAADAQQDEIDKSAVIQNQAITDGQEQAHAQAQEQMSERAKQAWQDSARLAVAAGEAGTSGNSVDIQMGDIQMGKATDVATIASNLQNKDKQIALGRKGLAAETQSKLNGASGPSWIGGGLQIAGAGYGAYQQGKINDAKLASTKGP